MKRVTTKPSETGVEAQTETQRLVALLRATEKSNPKPDDVRALRGALEKIPGSWRLMGDLARAAGDRLIDSINANEATKTSLRVGMQELKTDLGYDRSPLMEQMLIEEVAMCYISKSLIEYRYQTAMSESITLTLAAHWEKRLSTAQRRFLQAVETLARVRKMKLPALQVNIGQNQVNVATSATPSEARQ